MQKHEHCQNPEFEIMKGYQGYGCKVLYVFDNKKMYQRLPKGL